ncbi:hypothetical protein ABG768_018654 [Culter alburnus]|uniref:Uncharacterized protein n=1 Tax=Culter alburnus TaxID=194366 RepID=A0AAW2ASY8_CULAL
MLNRRRSSSSVGPSDHSDWLFSYCHLLVRKGISSYAGAERTCYLDPLNPPRLQLKLERMMRVPQQNQDLTLLSLWCQREKTIHPAARWRGQAA